MKKQIIIFSFFLIATLSSTPIKGEYSGVFREDFYTPIIVGTLDGLLGCGSKLSWCHYLLRIVASNKANIEFKLNDPIMAKKRSDLINKESVPLFEIVATYLQYSVGSNLGKKLRTLPRELRKFLNSSDHDHPQSSEIQNDQNIGEIQKIDIAVE